METLIAYVFKDSSPFIVALAPAILIWVIHMDRKISSIITRFDQFLQNGGTSTKTLDRLTQIEIRCTLNHHDQKEKPPG